MDAIQNATQKKTKKNDKIKCFQCSVVGHPSADCNIVICNYCEGPEHGGAECPLISAPKPRLCMYGYAHEELILFQLMCTDSYKPRLMDLRLASVTVIGGELTIPQVIHQL